MTLATDDLTRTNYEHLKASERFQAQNARHLENAVEDLRRELFVERNRAQRVAANLGFVNFQALEAAVNGDVELDLDHHGPVSPDDTMDSMAMDNDNDTNNNPVYSHSHLSSTSSSYALATVTIQAVKASMHVLHPDIGPSSALRILSFADMKALSGHLKSADGVLRQLVRVLGVLGGEGRGDCGAAVPGMERSGLMDGDEVPQPPQPQPPLSSLHPSKPAPQLSSSSSPTPSLDPQTLTSRLADLSQKYDLLSATKKKAAEKYKKDYKKWKAFKEWVFDTLSADPKYAGIVQYLEGDATRGSKVDIGLGIPMRDGAGVERAGGGQVDEAGAIADQREGERERRMSFGSEPPSPTSSSRCSRAPQLVVQKENCEPMPRTRARKRRHSDSALSPVSTKRLDPKEAFESAEDVEIEADEHEDDMDGEDEVLSTGLFTSKQKHSRRPKGTTINALYEIDPSKNDGVSYAFQGVVRGERRRQLAHAGDCECCRDYYGELKPMPPRAKAPLWRTPPRVQHNGAGTSTIVDFAEVDPFGEGNDAHKQRISRHRQQWAAPSTPPKYWSIAFPSTQEVVEINRQAKEMHASKLQQIQNEARQGGRYRKRAKGDR